MLLKWFLLKKKLITLFHWVFIGKNFWGVRGGAFGFFGAKPFFFQKQGPKIKVFPKFWLLLNF